MYSSEDLELCHGEKKYKEILFPVPDGDNAEGHNNLIIYSINDTRTMLTSQYIGTCKSAYTKGYALN